mgnify:CR=1 FL=1
MNMPLAIPKPRPTTSAMIASIAAEGQRVQAAPFGKALVELAAGSPGALLRHRRQWRELPEGLAERLLGLERDPLAALALARDLSEALDGDQQLWLTPSAQP